MGIYSGYDFTVIAQEALMPFASHILPITSFTKNFSDRQVNLGAAVQVPIITADGSGSTFNNSSNNYEDVDGDTVVLTNLEIGTHRKVTFAVTDVELGQYDVLKELAMAKGIELAKGTVTTLMNQITSGNFSTEVYTGAASAFDTDDMADCWSAADTAGWGMRRSAVLNNSFYTNMLKDDDLKNYLNSQTTDVLREAKIPRVAGFDLFSSSFLPSNSDSLAGFICDPSAIAIGTAVIKPISTETMISYDLVTDPMSGITLAQRVHYSNETGQIFITLEFGFGYKVMRGAALQRITTA